MIGCLGDLVEDVLVQLSSTIQHASDTEAQIHRRRGGSAATVAVVAASITGRSRFIGRLGSDSLGDRLIAELSTAGVGFAGQRKGRTGSIVVLVEPGGERTMLSDRGSSSQLDSADSSWLKGLSCLHVPFYSLALDPMATTAQRLITQAKESGLTVSVDASSVSVLREYGINKVVDLLRQLEPTILLCNEEEADVLNVSDGDPAALGAGMLIVKRGPRPATLLQLGADPILVPVPPCPPITNSTGAGDAFAAGFLCALGHGSDPEHSVIAGHHAACSYLTQ